MPSAPKARKQPSDAATVTAIVAARAMSLPAPGSAAQPASVHLVVVSLAAPTDDQAARHTSVHTSVCEASAPAVPVATSNIFNGESTAMAAIIIASSIAAARPIVIAMAAAISADPIDGILPNGAAHAQAVQTVASTAIADDAARAVTDLIAKASAAPVPMVHDSPCVTTIVRPATEIVRRAMETVHASVGRTVRLGVMAHHRRAAKAGLAVAVMAIAKDLLDRRATANAAAMTSAAPMVHPRAMAMLRVVTPADPMVLGRVTAPTAASAPADAAMARPIVMATAPVRRAMATVQAALSAPMLRHPATAQAHVATAPAVLAVKAALASAEPIAMSIAPRRAIANVATMIAARPAVMATATTKAAQKNHRPKLRPFDLSR